MLQYVHQQLLCVSVPTAFFIWCQLLSFFCSSYLHRSRLLAGTGGCWYWRRWANQKALTSHSDPANRGSLDQPGSMSRVQFAVTLKRNGYEYISHKVFLGKCCVHAFCLLSEYYYIYMFVIYHMYITRHPLLVFCVRWLCSRIPSCCVPRVGRYGFPLTSRVRRRGFPCSQTTGWRHDDVVSVLRW